jgi:hypothetical protein
VSLGVLEAQVLEIWVILFDAEGIDPGLELMPRDVLGGRLSSPRWLQVEDHNLVLPGREGRRLRELRFVEEGPLRLDQVRRGVLLLAPDLSREECEQRCDEA